MGPMVNHRRLASVQKLIEDAVSRGATVTTGGKPVEGAGFFFEPTVLTDVPADAAILHEEPFGPVAPVAAFDDLDAALELANSLPFGLAAYAYTDSAATAEKLIAGYEAGHPVHQPLRRIAAAGPVGRLQGERLRPRGRPRRAGGLPRHQARLAQAARMIWCRFEEAGVPVYGLVEDGWVTPVTGGPFGKYEKSNRRLAAADLRLLPPVIPSTFFCAGLNYRGHAQRAAYGGHEVPTRPEIGYRANNALTGHLSPIVRPSDCAEPLVAEGELVAVIGAPIRHATPEEARKAILGWTIGNDVSARGWQKSDRTFWRCKNSDTFKPMGPWIVTDIDPLAATTTVRVDHEVKAWFPTGDMLFGPYEYISAMSRYITLSPGDVVWMGTDETATVVPGQVVEITIDGIGTLANPVTQEYRAFEEEES